MLNPGKKILDRLYNIQKKTLQQIADIYGVSRERVRQWMEKFHLSRRRRGRKNVLDKSNIKICDEYIRGVPVVKLAKKYRADEVTVYKFLLECNPNIGLEKKRFKEEQRSKRCQKLIS